jgi:hypothetical protein
LIPFTHLLTRPPCPVPRILSNYINEVRTTIQ